MEGVDRYSIIFYYYTGFPLVSIRNLDEIGGRGVERVTNQPRLLNSSHIPSFIIAL